MTKILGYARVSSTGQDLNLQIDALLKAGCANENIYTDKASGSKSERKGLDKLLEQLNNGDTLLVWRLDRLGRSMSHLVGLIESLRKRGVGFRSLCDGAIDTTTASGQLIFNIFSALAEFESRLIKERIQAGLAAARSRGRKGGRKSIEKADPRVKTAKRMHQDRSLSIEEICTLLKVSRATFYRYIKM